MKAMYEKMNILYLQMADSLFGQGDKQDPSIPSALNHFQDKNNSNEPQTKEMKELEELRRKKKKMFELVFSNCVLHDGNFQILEDVFLVFQLSKKIKIPFITSHKISNLIK